VLRETDGVGSTVADYVYAGMLLISQQRGIGSAPLFYLVDGQNSTRALSDAAGVVTDAYDFDAFGETQASTGGTVNAYLYTGQQSEQGMGLYYLRARYYEPNTGRFLSRDPVTGSIFDPPAFHPYTYSRNDPMNRWDPHGKRGYLMELAVGAAVAGVLTTAVVISMYAIKKRVDQRAVSHAILSGLNTFMAMMTAGSNSRLQLAAGGNSVANSTMPLMDWDDPYADARALADSRSRDRKFFTDVNDGLYRAFASEEDLSAQRKMLFQELKLYASRVDDDDLRPFLCALATSLNEGLINPQYSATVDYRSFRVFYEIELKEQFRSAEARINAANAKVWRRYYPAPVHCEALFPW
jgi:RHS repeat-associated protein